MVNPLRKYRAAQLFARARQCDEAGKVDEALALYLESLALDEGRPAAHYNVGLIYKYRAAWAESFRYNQRAVELAPEDEAAQWNLAIAATALRDWKTARAVWTGRGMDVGSGEGPIEVNFGIGPVRLDPDDAGEVVWAQRLCPVRAKIVNIPFPDSGVAYGDVVLHDGAPVGSRVDRYGVERSVFNVLALFEAVGSSTFVVVVRAAEVADMEALDQLCDGVGAKMEDWTGNVLPMCRACSEGRAHEKHDHDGGPGAWIPERRIGVAGYKAEKLAVVRDGFEAWFGEGQRAASGVDRQINRGQLLTDIEHLRKALARGSGGQD